MYLLFGGEKGSVRGDIAPIDTSRFLSVFLIVNCVEVVWFLRNVS